VVWSGDYQPFGTLNAATSQISTALQDLRLPGQEFDAETGLYHNGFRDYAPGLGRYLQSDPVGLFGGTNTYLYGGSNPIRAVDPLGLCLSEDIENAKKWFAEQAEEKAKEKALELTGLDESQEELLRWNLTADEGSAAGDAFNLGKAASAEFGSAKTAWDFGYVATKPMWDLMLSDPDLFPHYGTDEYNEKRDLIDLWFDVGQNPQARAQLCLNMGWYCDTLPPPPPQPDPPSTDPIWKEGPPAPVPDLNSIYCQPGMACYEQGDSIPTQ